MSRFVSIAFPDLMTDWMLRRHPELNGQAFVLAATERGRRVIKASDKLAQAKGITAGMGVADCKALEPDLNVLDFNPDKPAKLLRAIAEWCIRYCPLVSMDLPDGLMLDASGCTHLWGGEQAYLNDIERRLSDFGYEVRLAMADTIGAAWAVCRFADRKSVVEPGKQAEALQLLPPAALRLDSTMVDKFHKLGLTTIGSFMDMPRTALRRRFGQSLLTRMDLVLGNAMDLLDAVRPVAPYEERLPCLEPIRTAPGIEIAIKTLLETLCQRLYKESKGLRKCVLRCYRVDGNLQSIDISTSRPSRNTAHLFRLFETRISQIEPDLGIELFALEATVVEELLHSQDALWTISSASESALAELLDRIAGKTGVSSIHRYLPAEHYWPERSYRDATSLKEQPGTHWRSALTRPLHILPVPEAIEVSVLLPDYPPFLFRYKGTVHNIKKADGPERIEQEWWQKEGLYRDYYRVEDEAGARYWLFRLGNYASDEVKWFIHGFFA